MHFVLGYNAAAHTSIKSAINPETMLDVPVDLVNAPNKFHNPKSKKIKDPMYLKSSSVVMIN